MLWSQPQRADEKVEDYTARARKMTKRINMETTSVCNAILHGQRPALRMFVLQQAPVTIVRVVSFLFGSPYI
jgi:hypothetical protein